MKPRSLLASPLLWIGIASVVLATAIGCSSSSGPEGTSHPDSGVGSGSDAGTGADTSDGGGSAESGQPSDSGHGAPAPDALYGCAVTGGFGWPCTATTSGPDPTDCTDPAFPDCFAGGQGGWCTKSCTSGADCMTTEDAGCSPASCNMRGFCK